MHTHIMVTCQNISVLKRSKPMKGISALLIHQESRRWHSMPMQEPKGIDETAISTLDGKIYRFPSLEIVKRFI